ncbi:flowering time control protein FCA isoform X2 [Cynara cardunculus var. scolymus]|uniref:flowering time control protein FCA isoform X2 n=1 Tax=Cynara cardunculus var. scolymus TaxID=59895 RepID=UPI000D62D71F|nr:flowering time control protein FCA isoform X2 [Cynara cardunculus var. scolymus]
MDQHREYRSSWSYDNSVPPLPYHDFNHGGGFSNYNHPGRYQNHYQDVATEPTDSFGTAFVGRKRQFSQSAHGPPEYNDGGSCAKLYVRGVPREVTEQDIRSIFGKHGNIIEVVLFKELKSLHEQECCFVKYAKIEEATQAIRALHNHHTFPGGMRPIEVKYASKKQERPGCSRSVIGCLRTHECKVFVGFLNKQASKAEITEIFSPYGCVEDVFLLRDEYKQNRGIGFISFSHKDMAAAAIIALNGKYVMKIQRSQKLGNTGLHRMSVIQLVKPHYLIVHTCLHKPEVSLHQFPALVLWLQVVRCQIHLIVIGVSMYVLMAMHTTIIV